MEHRNLHTARDALQAIRGIVIDAMESRPHKPQLHPITRLDLAYDFRRLQHAQICHYLRCDASREVLQLVQEAADLLLDRLKQHDDSAETALEIVEPFRHHLYSSVIVVALIAADRDEVKREQEYWRNRNAAKIAPAYHEAAGV